MEAETKTSLALGILAWAALLSVFLAQWVSPILTFIVFPIPFAMTASLSLEGFRRESLAALSVVPGMFLGPEFLVVSLTIAAGCPWVSFQAQNVYNGRNELYTLYKAPTIAVVLLGIVLTGLVVYQYHTDPVVREDVMNRAVEFSLRFSSLAGVEQAQGRQLEFARGVAQLAVQDTRSRVYDEMSASGTVFSAEQMDTISRGFQGAATEVPDAIAANLEAGSQEVGAADLRALLKEQIRPLMEPGNWLYIAIFVTVMSVVWFFQIPFGVICALYGKLVFRHALFQRICGE